MRKTPIHKNRICTFCGGDYTPRSASSKYCSMKCRDTHYRESGKFYWAQRRYTDRKHTEPFKGARQCLVCGLWFRAVCHHAWQAHNLSEAEYKEIAGLDHKKGLIPEDLKEVKAEHVRENGTIENLKSGKVAWFVPGDTKAGRYKRSPQTMERLKRQSKLIHGRRTATKEGR